MAVQEQRWALMQEDLTVSRASGTQHSAHWMPAHELETAFADAYKDRAATWDAVVREAGDGQGKLVQDAAVKAASVGSEAVLNQLARARRERSRTRAA